ncbi:MAG: glutamine-hydrolyzing carbamoyl-phosphate synthase small subunit [Alphaproteobacteria bacterium]|nr:glutamine-hydrolyzing carbamoyl-phosphate synthase small subunit [Alphaproteobacteria bacterium]
MPQRDASANDTRSREVVCPPQANAALVLADGTVFFGNGIGKQHQSIAGELCFNTAMTGYQEILTDPSYAGQIITFTFPHIGNTGVNSEDIESQTTSARGLITREPITPPSNFRSQSDFDTWLAEREITGISGIDTRALTRKIRLEGPQNAVIYYSDDFGDVDVTRMREKAAGWKDLMAFDLTQEVSASKASTWTQSSWTLEAGYANQDSPEFHVVAVDYGVKYNTLRRLAERGCKITVVPANSAADDILALKPDGVFLSNGPGDPKTTAEFATPMIQNLITQNIPLFGICLGHQLIALALGGSTEKMRQGHRGANHPIRNEQTGEVEITSQNHGYVVSNSNWPENVEITHSSLFDGTIAGLRMTNKPVFAVQYHPESSPGPHDSQYLFSQFIDMMEATRHTAKKANQV